MFWQTSSIIITWVMLIFATFLIIFRKFCGLKLVVYNYCQCNAEESIQNFITPWKHVYKGAKDFAVDIFNLWNVIRVYEFYMFTVTLIMFTGLKTKLSWINKKNNFAKKLLRRAILYSYKICLSVSLCLWANSIAITSWYFSVLIQLFKYLKKYIQFCAIQYSALLQILQVVAVSEQS